MNVHKNARLTPAGRLLLVQRIEVEGWEVSDAAEAAGISVRRSYCWLARYRAGGEPALADRCSAPHRCKHSLDAERIEEIERLRRQRMSGPAIAGQLNMPVSSVGAVLRRRGLGKLAALDPRVPVVRYQRERPGELIHIDIKKLGRIDGVGHRITGDRRGGRGRGWEHVHVCIRACPGAGRGRLAPGLQRGDGRREEGERGRVPGAGRRLVGRPWRHRRAGDDR